MMTTTAALVSQPRRARAYVKTLERFLPSPLADGREPESRVVLCGISWDDYLAFDKALGNDRPGPRFNYLGGELEIMTPSGEHERLKVRFTVLMEVYFEAADIEAAEHGQATMRLTGQQVGAEPDMSWCLHTDKEFPDIVLEIALTSGGVRKLDLCVHFAVPEVWFWRNGRLEAFALSADGSGYEPLASGRSRLLPGLDLGLLERCVMIQSRKESRRAFLAGLEAGK